MVFTNIGDYLARGVSLLGGDNIKPERFMPPIGSAVPILNPHSYRQRLDGLLKELFGRERKGDEWWEIDVRPEDAKNPVMNLGKKQNDLQKELVYA